MSFFLIKSNKACQVRISNYSLIIELTICDRNITQYTIYIITVVIYYMVYVWVLADG